LNNLDRGCQVRQQISFAFANMSCTKITTQSYPWKEVLSKRVAILGEGIACNQDPDSLHCKALKRAKSLGELKINSLAIIRLILIFLVRFCFKIYQYCYTYNNERYEAVD
jgi:hypothetical protein